MWGRLLKIVQDTYLHPIIAGLAERPLAELTESERVLLQALTGPFDEQEAYELRLLVGQFFGRKASDGISELFEGRGWTSDLLDQIVTGERTWDDLP